MEAGKETAANFTASAKAGMQKTKATIDEKVSIYIYIYIYIYNIWLFFLYTVVVEQ
jgi:hypothetical protein